MHRTLLPSRALLTVLFVGASANATTLLGNTTDVLFDLTKRDVESTMRLALPLDDGTQVPLVVSRYRLDEDGLTMTGFVEGQANDPFVFRGNERKLYGWVYLRSEGLAFEYHTDDRGLVFVEEVPISRVCSSCDGASPPRHVVPSNPALHAPVTTINAKATANEPHLGDYPGTDLLTLESRPGATKVLYLNIAPILDKSGAPSSETAGTNATDTAWTKADLWRVWQTVAAGFSAFEVNVTTNPKVFAATATKNVGVANFVAKNDTSVCYQSMFGAGDYQCTIYAKKAV